MNKDIHTEEKVDRALASLDNLRRAKANPFLYEKISGRMKDPVRSKSFGPKFIFAAVNRAHGRSAERFLKSLWDVVDDAIIGREVVHLEGVYQS